MGVGTKTTSRDMHDDIRLATRLAAIDEQRAARRYFQVSLIGSRAARFFGHIDDRTADAYGEHSDRVHDETSSENGSVHDVVVLQLIVRSSYSTLDTNTSSRHQRLCRIGDGECNRARQTTIVDFWGITINVGSFGDDSRRIDDRIIENDRRVARSRADDRRASSSYQKC